MECSNRACLHTPFRPDGCHPNADHGIMERGGASLGALPEFPESPATVIILPCAWPGIPDAPIVHGEAAERNLLSKFSRHNVFDATDPCEPIRILQQRLAASSYRWDSSLDRASG